jgi:uncharacterized small protein (DUF1192 family)
MNQVNVDLDQLASDNALATKLSKATQMAILLAQEVQRLEAELSAMKAEKDAK